jgi:hypothetical protein
VFGEMELTSDTIAELVVGSNIQFNLVAPLISLHVIELLSPIDRGNEMVSIDEPGTPSFCFKIIVYVVYGSEFTDEFLVTLINVICKGIVTLTEI